MKTDKHVILSVSLKVAFIAATFCSTVYLLMLGWYNNFLLDDYGFIAETDRSGVLGMVHDMYYFQQSRFSAFLVLGGILKVWGHATKSYYTTRASTDTPLNKKWLQ